MDTLLNAIVYCEGAFNTPNGKTAHGLVRFTRRYRVLSVIDSRYVGMDAGAVLDGKENGIKIYRDIESAYRHSIEKGMKPDQLVIGIAPDGGRLSKSDRESVINAVRLGLNVDSGLHDYLIDDIELVSLAKQYKVVLRDIRKPPPVNDLHFFSGNIEKVKSLKIAILGTDSAIGKRTTAWLIVEGLNRKGIRAEMIGTGQTAWLQGAEYSIVMDSIINDFVSGEIENAVYRAYLEKNPDIIVIEGQGSLMNPAYPGGFEILAAGRPDLIILQHAPMRRFYDGFPNYPLHPLERQLELIRVLSAKPVIAVTVNHENIRKEDIPSVCRELEREIGIPCIDPFSEDIERLIELAISHLKKGEYLQDGS